MNDKQDELVSIAETSSDDLLQVLCRTAIALYCCDLLEQNGAVSEDVARKSAELEQVFSQVRLELLTRSTRGERKRKRTIA